MYLRFKPLSCWWLIWPAQNDAKILKNYRNPGKWVLIWEYSARAIQWVPTWQGLDEIQKSLRFCALDESSLSIRRVKGGACWRFWFLLKVAMFDELFSTAWACINGEYVAVVVLRKSWMNTLQSIPRKLPCWWCSTIAAKDVCILRACKSGHFLFSRDS